MKRRINSKIINQMNILVVSESEQYLFPRCGRHNRLLLKSLGMKKWLEFWKPINDFFEKESGK